MTGVPLAEELAVAVPDAALDADPALLAALLLAALLLELDEPPQAATATATPSASALARHFRRTLISSSLRSL